MNKLAHGTTTLALCAVLTACSGTAEQTGPVVGVTASGSPGTAGPSSSPSSTSTTRGRTTTTPSSAAPTAGGPTTTSSTSSTAAAVAIDQSTPEGALTAWLGSMVSGDSTAVCGLMASGGTPITEIGGAGKRCSTTIAPTVSALKEVGAAFAGLSIKGATVKGNEATFEKATTQPALAAKVISSLKAVKIASKWYVTP